MNRGVGTGLIGLGVVMVVLGAILTFAITVTAQGFNIHTVGLILLWAGIGVVILGAVGVAVGGRRHVTRSEDVRTTPSGHQRVERQDDWATP